MPKDKEEEDKGYETPELEGKNITDTHEYDVSMAKRPQAVVFNERGFLKAENLEKRQWEWAQRKQQEIIKNTGKEEFKLSRNAKEFSPDAQTQGYDQLFNSFISVKADENAPPKLYEMSTKGHIIDKGKFGKVKCGRDEQGNIYAIKIISRVKKETTQTTKTTKTDDDLNEIAIEKKIGMSKGGFTRTSESRKNIEGGTLSVPEGSSVEKEYQVKEFLGKSLKSILTDIEMGWREDFTPEEKKEIAMKLLESLEQLHAQNVIHRDIHEGNILINVDSSGKLKVSIIDFGLAVALKPGEDKFYHQKNKGFNYLLFAPEQEKLFTKPSNGKAGRLSSDAYFDRATDNYAAGLLIQRRLGIDVSGSLLHVDPAQRTKAKALADIQKPQTEPRQPKMSI